MSKRIFVNITGEAGSGKSTLAILLKKFLEEKGYYVDLKDSKDVIDSYSKDIDTKEFKGDRTVYMTSYMR